MVEERRHRHHHRRESSSFVRWSREPKPPSRARKTGGRLTATGEDRSLIRWMMAGSPGNEKHLQATGGSTSNTRPRPVRAVAEDLGPSPLDLASS